MLIPGLLACAGLRGCAIRSVDFPMWLNSLLWVGCCGSVAQGPEKMNKSVSSLVDDKASSQCGMLARVTVQGTQLGVEWHLVLPFPMGDHSSPHLLKMMGTEWSWVLVVKQTLTSLP